MASAGSYNAQVDAAFSAASDPGQSTTETRNARAEHGGGAPFAAYPFVQVVDADTLTAPEDGTGQVFLDHSEGSVLVPADMADKNMVIMQGDDVGAELQVHPAKGAGVAAEHSDKKRGWSVKCRRWWRCLALAPISARAF